MYIKNSKFELFVKKTKFADFEATIFRFHIFHILYGKENYSRVCRFYFFQTDYAN